MIEGGDLDLVRECLKGNTKAFEGLIDRYQKPVFNVALRMLGNIEDAQEIAQIVFVKAFEKLNTFNTDHKLFTWLYRIAINESINHRKARRHHELLIEEETGRISETPETIYAASELHASIDKALAALKEEHRTVVILKHFQDLSYEEISQVLEIPAKTVKSRLFTAREKLRELLLHQL